MEATKGLTLDSHTDRGLIHNVSNALLALDKADEPTHSYEVLSGKHFCASTTEATTSMLVELIECQRIDLLQRNPVVVTPSPQMTDRVGGPLIVSAVYPASANSALKACNVYTSSNGLKSGVLLSCKFVVFASDPL